MEGLIKRMFRRFKRGPEVVGLGVHGLCKEEERAQFADLRARERLELYEARRRYRRLVHQIEDQKARGAE